MEDPQRQQAGEGAGPSDDGADVQNPFPNAPNSGSQAPYSDDSTALQQVDFDDFGSLFSLRRPKDFKAGLSSGLKSLAKGIAGGVVGLVAAPAVGAYQEGALGFLKGFGIGLAGVIILPTTGAIIGTTQMVRGAVNTPEAIHGLVHGRHWDQERRVWRDAPELALMLDEDGYYDEARERWCEEREDVVFNESGDYYEMLQVPKTATEEQIRKQYFLLARKYHPDKNPDDEQAKERFQKLGQAYQVLADADLRARYDAGGKESVDADGLMDGAEFFNMLFGSDRFCDLVGELLICTAARNGGMLRTSQMAKIQHLRIARVSRKLLKLLEAWEAGEQDGFRTMIEAKARLHWVQASYGDNLLRTVGRVYLLQAQIFLGGFFDGALAKMRSHGAHMRSQLNAISSTVKVLAHQQELAKAERKGSPVQARVGETSGEGPSATEARRQEDIAATTSSAAEAHKLQEAALPLMLEAMWAANVVDIESTIRSVCNHVLHGRGIDRATAQARALGLQEMGRIFMAVAAEFSGNDKPSTSSGADQASKVEAAKLRMQDTMQAIVEKKFREDDERHAAQYE